MVSTHVKNISQIGSFPQVGMNIKLFETTSQKRGEEENLFFQKKTFVLSGSSRSSP